MFAMILSWTGSQRVRAAWEGTALVVTFVVMGFSRFIKSIIQHDTFVFWASKMPELGTHLEICWQPLRGSPRGDRGLPSVRYSFVMSPLKTSLDFTLLTTKMTLT